MSKKQKSRLAQLGVYGFDAVEPVILTALVTRDPLLLIGDTGTGKTFLLNSLSEALGLEHRHYNASLISFDDLVGFPYPDAEHGGVKFLETPATVWGAQSVLIDEISRCKPEHQNRLFSLVQERRIQGIALDSLIYRWAAMNPCSEDQTSFQEYAGSMPLDPALADRFALFVKAVDWADFTDQEKAAVANPVGDGAISDDHGELMRLISDCRKNYLKSIPHISNTILRYVSVVTDALLTTNVRISPRRTRMLSKSLLAATFIEEEYSANLFKQILTCSLPHVAWGEEVKPEYIANAHSQAWGVAHSTKERAWVSSFVLARKLSKKLELLINDCPGKEVGTQAIEQMIACETPERMAAFALAVFPAASLELIPIGAEGVHDLGQIAAPVLSVDGAITWQERKDVHNTHHPDFLRYSQVLDTLEGSSQQLARQLFYWCLINKHSIAEPGQLVEEMNKCIQIIQSLE